MSATTFSSTESANFTAPCAFELPAQELQDLFLAPPINRDRLLEQCLSNLDFALMLLGEFETTSESRLSAFDAALAEQDSAAIASKAHALKGVAGILAADALMSTCTQLESTAKAADWNHVRELIQQLRHEMQRAKDFIPKIRATA